MTIREIKEIHCIGIGGIGVSALAQLWRAQGKEVSGSDVEESEITNELAKQGILIKAELFHAQSSALAIDLVIYSDAVPDDHPERVAARAAKIPELSYAQALGEVSRGYRTIVVTGTHGKSTTTALLGLMLEAAGMDPLVIVGSKVREWGNSNLRLCTTPHPSSTRRGNDDSSSPARGEVRRGGSGWFVVEGDDYRDHFLELQPHAVVITSIEWDHPDYFQDLEHTVESFKKLVEKVPTDGPVVINQDDVGCVQLQEQIGHSPIRTNRRILNYGRGSEMFKALTLQVPGEFNRYNATAAATAAIELGVPREVVAKVAREFKGVWRRFEVVGEILFPERSVAKSKDTLNQGSPSTSSGVNIGVLVISDYAHHPTAVRVTMKAAREAYPGQRLVLVYQPHQHSRTKHLFNDFVEVLKDAADLTIVSEIYAVKGRMEDRDVSSQMLVEKIQNSKLKMQNVLYGGNLEQTKRVVLEQIKPGDVVIFMGAGDIDNLARELCRKS